MNAMHQAVLLNEAIEGLKIVPNGTYVDGTFGRGGHSRAILNQLNDEGRLLAFDKDQEAIDYAHQHFANDKRFNIVHHSFSDLEKVAVQLGLIGQIDGILLDLGVSSPQLDDAHRGFSFMKNGPLDMRMNHQQSFSAASFVNQASVEEMTHVFRTYGEERFALRIARAIERERANQSIQTTEVLAEIVKAANPKWEKHKHPATRVFQAIRIHVNNELDDLIQGLKAAIQVLAPKGRLAVISFHSLEDRLVKQFMKTEEEGIPIPSGVPVKETELAKTFKRIGKAIKPTEEEMKNNVRARSAVLRIGEKLS